MVIKCSADRKNSRRRKVKTKNGTTILWLDGFDLAQDFSPAYGSEWPLVWREGVEGLTQNHMTFSEKTAEEGLSCKPAWSFE